MDDTTTKIGILIYNFAIVALASYLVAVHEWSLWTYLGFACFMATTTKVKDE